MGVMSGEGMDDMVWEMPVFFQARNGTWVQRDAKKTCNGSFGIPTLGVLANCDLIPLVGKPVYS